MRARIFAADGELLGETELRDEATEKRVGIAMRVVLVLDEPEQRRSGERALCLAGRLEPM